MHIHPFIYKNFNQHLSNYRCWCSCLGFSFDFAFFPTDESSGESSSQLKSSSESTTVSTTTMVTVSIPKPVPTHSNTDDKLHKEHNKLNKYPSSSHTLLETPILPLVSDEIFIKKYFVCNITINFIYTRRRHTFE